MSHFVDLVQAVEEHIDEYGWAVQGIVPGEERAPSWTYSIGASLLGLPDLFIVGVNARIGQLLINDTLTQVRERTHPAPRHGDLIDWIANFPVAVVQVDREIALSGDWFNVAKAWAKSRGIELPTYLQLVFPDKNGNWYEPDFIGQPILGERWWKK